jgi:hypothetical protein
MPGRLKKSMTKWKQPLSLLRFEPSTSQIRSGYCCSNRIDTTMWQLEWFIVLSQHSVKVAYCKDISAEREAEHPVSGCKTCAVPYRRWTDFPAPSCAHWQLPVHMLHLGTSVATWQVPFWATYVCMLLLACLSVSALSIHPSPPSQEML